MSKKITVAVLFGGRSAEHEVSLRSARTVVSALDHDKYEVLLIGINREGKWLLDTDSKGLLNAKEVSGSEAAIVVPGDLVTSGSKQNQKIDVIFPVLHGPYGEDGTIQGLAKLADVPCVGADVLGSAIGMDKDVMKRLLRDADIPIGSFSTVRYPDKNVLRYADFATKHGKTLFIKPANMGSSVGVTKVDNETDFQEAVATAFQYDKKIIIEENIEGREIECSVLGNDSPKASLPGEIISNDSFYSYDAKYASDSKSSTKIPADISDDQIKLIQDLALKTYTILECRGMARVDFFLKPNGQVLVNEINTLPGFTSISMYPKMWEASGMTLQALVDSLITLAIEEFDQRKKLLNAPK